MCLFMVTALANVNDLTGADGDLICLGIEYPSSISTVNDHGDDYGERSANRNPWSSSKIIARSRMRLGERAGCREILPGLSR